MYDETARIAEIELRPIRSKGELVVDDWWEVPEPAREPFWRRHWLAILTVCLPVAIAILYFGVIASDQYVSETRFIVRTSSNGDSANLASFMQDQKITRATDETSAVSEYIVSRDALAELVANNNLLQILSRRGADIFNRFPNFYSRDSRESLYRHFKDFVDVHIEAESGIATLRVRAFTPEDSQALSRGLIKDAEGFVNRLNARVYQDTLALANKSVAEEKARFSDVEDKLERFRNEQKVIDPNREAAAALVRVGALMSKPVESGEHAPARDRADAEKSANRVDERERPVVARRNREATRADFGIGRLPGGQVLGVRSVDAGSRTRLRRRGGAVTQLAKARQDLAQQQYYLQTIVEPNLPDQATYPRRILSILLVFVISFCVFWIVNALLKNVREHQT